MGEHVDVLIVGAGISGIGMAVHLQKDCPGKSFALLERKDNLGGTWNLFRYPGIRSDSDMHTLGFVFEPWREQKAIADGPSILAYLNKIADHRGLREHIRFGHKVLSADWNSDTARWTVTTENTSGERSVHTANYLYMGSGYYDYDQGYDPEFAGREDFAGQIVHPQFWPENLDYAGKKIVVIGSGATAVTLLPSMAKDAAHITMLQRTPTWYFIRNSEDWFANTLRKIMPDSWAYWLVRFKNVRMQRYLFNKARKDPAGVGEFLMKQVRADLGGDLDPKDYTPPYGPWEQRLCMIPDSDMFKAIRSGKAGIVTDHIDRFTKTGIALKSGKHLDADIIITATGLKLAVAGKVAFTVDGKAVNFHEHYYYKGCMFSDIPNLSIVFGYLNASWTLKADIVSSYTCRVINHMDAAGADIANPVFPRDGSVTSELVFDFSSGYVQRSLDFLPLNGSKAPWTLNQDYLGDRKILLKDAVDDGVLQFGKARPVAATAPELMAAE